jgi:hypothetical protein
VMHKTVLSDPVFKITIILAARQVATPWPFPNRIRC